MVLSRGPRRRSTTTRLTKRRRRRARGRLSSVSTAPTCLSTARTSRGRSGHRSQLKDSEYIPLLRKMPESRGLLTTWRPRVKKPKSSPGGGASNRRLYRRAAAEDAGVSQRAFDDVEAARQEADVAFRWRALCECEDNRCRLSVEGTLRMRGQPMSPFGGGHFANAKTTDNRPDRSQDREAKCACVDAEEMRVSSGERCFCSPC